MITRTKGLVQFLLSAAAIAVCASASVAQELDLVKNGTEMRPDFTARTEEFNHTRIEAKIPMRDGVKLFTVITIPKNAGRQMPIVLTRTPYDAGKRSSRYTSPDAAMRLKAADEPLLRNGYIRVYQDIRGKYDSEGDYIMNLPLRGIMNSGEIDHATDTWDTIEWLINNVEGNSGRVGITGVSYDGYLTLMALFDPHPALKAAIPMNAMVDGWIGDDWYHNGAFRPVMMEYVYVQMTSQDSEKRVPYGYYDIYQAILESGSTSEFGKRYGVDELPTWRRFIDNPAYNSFWQEQAVDKLLEGVALTVPTMHIHSLFDQEDIYGPIASYLAQEKKDRRNDKNFLVMGPWHHGQQMREGSQLGAIKWDADTSLYFREKVMMPFWDEHLKGIKPTEKLPPVYAFETGTNVWKSYKSWPATKNSDRTRLYLQPGGKLGFEKMETASGAGYDEYISDPAKPIPYRVRPIVPSFFAEDSTWRRWLADDQRHAADRTDVLIFVSDRLTEPLTISGEVTANLFASTSGTDSDWVVKLIDVYPNEVPADPAMGGYQLMISGDILRGRYRQDITRATPIPAGEVLPYKVRMPHANHTFEAGHRIMVQVQSSWFPVYDRNPQTFVENVAYAEPEDYRKATQRIYHSGDMASFLEIPLQK